ncbi:MAG: hypothetical protein ACE5HF_03460 [Gemmatimonadota bacterium]
MRPDRARVMMEGLVAGLLGYAAVALFFGVVNLIGGRNFFYTAARLGSGLTGAAPGAADTAVLPGPVFAYNGVHLLAFLVIGFVAAWLVFETEKHPDFFPIFLFIALGGAFANVAAFTAISEIRSGELSLWAVLGANAAAGAAMGAYLVRAHPRLWRELREGSDPEAEEGVS